ncbi:carboxypeptidase-like regulatory domain-containing protein [Flavilitoribacter nigricans]|uniref:Carboxypeptidase-like regulatory domain-containing protein n=1 Tax=Flavilitoribacter nigricans (strain ATCC 23147 / DSM 23189 / NBRC 102662 / NCIMB 1420 / SS-2) TaxID=1122177 RepID=A0A2D0NFX1_FLAN2|nr:carboxypeptidase-like regulatory domain-containing protein [Flavilitoribacter nigricans]PHN07402.1 hypothetical protein CRP01_07165 [Flavilitoribacter nigricans DSM 23189 = NBRC 102662]
MRALMTLLALVAGLHFLCGQSVLSGRVTEAGNQQPVPFATVYFDGTTTGQTTDEDGRFQLSVSGIELPAVLVVSHVGYETLTLPVKDTKEELQLEIRIREQVMSTVVVQDRNQRQKNLQEFRQLFLGSDAWGQAARILNEEALVFNRDYVNQKLVIRNDYMRKMVQDAKRPNIQWAADGSYVTFDQAVNLEATAKVPLEVELPDLGYTVRVDLKSFETIYKQGTTSYFGHFFFQGKEGGDAKRKRRFEKKRERAYYNSSLHFLRALYQGALAENGYRLLEEERKGDGRNTAIVPFDIQPYLKPVGNDQLEITGLAGRNLIVLYYGDRKGQPLPESRWKNRQPVQSGLHFGDQECVIRADGTTGESSLYFSGNLGNRGVSWLLPSDYQTEAENK